jgi:hypothetical protein
LSDVSKTRAILDASADWLPKSARKVAIVLVALGVVGLGLGFGASGDPGAGWAALLTPIVMIIGIAMVGPLTSAIFQMTGTKWGRAYRRIAEGSVALMPLGLAGLLVLMAGGNAYLPWVHEHPHLGGKAFWLTRGFWDARVLGGLLVAYAVGLAFVRLSLKRDFCNDAVSDKYNGFFAKHLKKGITSAEPEAGRIERRLSMLAPLVAVVYGVVFSMLGFDLIMALEPDWFSTLFGAWYFIGNLLAGFALLAVLSVAVSKQPGMDRFLTRTRQSDMATLLLAFCLINADFFWNQYLTIWYANLPEETFYVIERTVDEAGPWRSLSFVSLATFFVVPFALLLLRKVKQSRLLLTGVGVVAIVGVFMARFIEIAPSVLTFEGGGSVVIPLVSAGLVFLGFLGGGLLLYLKLFSGLPILAVNDEIFLKEMAKAVEDE